MNKNQLKNDINNLIRQYYRESGPEKIFIPGKTPILTGEAVYGSPEIEAIISTLIDGWFGLGRRGEEFEKNFSEYIGLENSIFVNSGSSANLLALNAIKSAHKLRGGEIITPAATFPTTFNPIIQLGFTPAVVDIDSTLNISLSGLEKAINSKTRGIMFAHSLGNPARVEEIAEIARKNNLFLIEDCCDALGAKYNNKLCGQYGDLSTFSFYPAHGITTGEGGVISTDNSEFRKILRSLRDWGRDCWCNTDEKNILGTCRSRFNFNVNGIPYDHKYIYSQIGYNVKPLELQAAMGIEQLKRLPAFIDIRKNNYKYYREQLKDLEEFIDFPNINPKSEPVFFGLPIILKDKKYDRKNITLFLNDKKIATRLLFAGNILRQPAYKNENVVVYESLTNSDKRMEDCFWIGLHPGVDAQRIDYVADKLKEYFKQY